MVQEVSAWFTHSWSWPCPVLRDRCWECSDAPRNVDSPESLLTRAGVFGSVAGHPLRCLAGVLLSKGWGSLVLHSMHPVQFLCVCVFLKHDQDSLCGELAVVSVFAQRSGPFSFLLRQQQLQQPQQKLAQVTTVMSRTTTVGEQQINNVMTSLLMNKQCGGEKNISTKNSRIKVSRTKKAPSSMGLALGRPWSLTQILPRRFSVCSLASILVKTGIQHLFYFPCNLGISPVAHWWHCEWGEVELLFTCQS